MCSQAAGSSSLSLAVGEILTKTISAGNTEKNGKTSVVWLSCCVVGKTVVVVDICNNNQWEKRHERTCLLIGVSN